MIAYFSYCFFSDLRKEILIFPFQNVMFYTIWKNYLFKIIWDFDYKVVPNFLIEYRPQIFSLSYVSKNIKYLNNFPSTILFASNHTFKRLPSWHIFWINNHIKDNFIIFWNLKFLNIFNYIVFFDAEKDYLFFRRYAYIAISNIKNHTVWIREIVIFNLKVKQILLCFDKVHA